MMTSETRGVARGAMPKRSRSARGPPVCIISMAQQARPNIMYQTDDFRVQLSRSSIFAVSAISGAVLISDMSLASLRRLRRLAHAGLRPAWKPLQPLEVALHPDVDQPHREDADEEEDLDERVATPTALDLVAEDGRDRIDERELDVEDHEHERDQVEADVEVDPGRPARRLAALVGAELRWMRVVGTEQLPEPQHEPAQHERERREHEHVGPLKVHRGTEH